MVSVYSVKVISIMATIRLYAINQSGKLVFLRVLDENTVAK